MMTKRPIRSAWVIGIVILLGVSTIGCTGRHTSKYVDEADRRIKTLSPDDIEELRNGEGWGLAKAAELNGVPGPAHLLPMADKIDLTPKQIEQIEALFEKMRNRAIPLGRRLIDLERRLNEEFADGTVSDEGLRDLLAEIAETRMELRYIHLVTHLETPEILRPEQITEYNRLRGYGEGHEVRHDHGS